VTCTDGFVRDADAVLRVITGCFGGATAFPVHRLRETYAGGPRRRPTHILMISDDGIDTMFANDERGNSGWDIAAAALRHARGGGTMALNIPENWPYLAQSKYPDPWKKLVRARDEQRWDVHAVADMAQLVAFAAAFSRRRWADAADRGGSR
jgi:hypothetical protein